MPRGQARPVVSRSGALTSPARKLPPQLFLHDDVLRPEISPVHNDRKALGKPRGGFCTSSYERHYGSGWVRWCVAYRYNEPLGLHWTVLSVRKSARIAIIDSPSDLAAWIERYPRLSRGRRGLDFERLAEEYDGLRLTHQGYLRTRSRQSKPFLIGWDCEATIWFRWVFTEWHEVEPYFKNIDRFDAPWSSQKDVSTLAASKRVYEMMIVGSVAGVNPLRVRAT